MKQAETPLGQECTCDCECCQEKRQGKDVFWQMRTNDTVGASFLGVLALLLLVFLVRANRRNRELLLEVFELRRQS